VDYIKIPEVNAGHMPCPEESEEYLKSETEKNKKV
jgi:hypothetical protein